MSMLNRCAQRFRERNGRIQMESIDRRSSTRYFLSYYWRTKKWIRERMPAEIPRSQEVVFRSRSVDRRQFLSVDEKHVIPLAPPSVLILEHRHRDANEMSTPGRFHPDVVAFAVEVLLIIDER